MRLPAAWIREFADPAVDARALARSLTMAGVMVDGVVREGDDDAFEFDITPNRGDCLSVLGIAREVAAIHRLPAPAVAAPGVPATHRQKVDVRIDDDGCTVYCGRVVRGVDAQRASPDWLQRRLRAAGIQPQGAAVDVAAYVMLETGQPLHAFDRATLRGGVHVRRARAGERLALLDGTAVEAAADMLVIADDERAIALAGVMGGADTAVGAGTRDVFIESAHFTPLAVAGRARRLGLHTDASLRFERGVDPAMPRRALERATRLLLDIAGGEAGPVVSAGAAPGAAAKPIHLRRARITHLLGVAVADADVVGALQRLQFRVRAAKGGWTVAVPSHRFDVALEADLIEEVARIHGYDHIPAGDAPMATTVLPATERAVSEQALAATLVHRGYQQVVTYSFVDPALHARVGQPERALALHNPISADLSEMRTSLWPGLVACLRYNVNRQSTRARIFEYGLRFLQQDADLIQENMIAALAWGDRHEPQWGQPHGDTDFFDLKADCDALLAGAGGVEYVADRHPALHPGQTARVVVDGRDAGWIGTLHPEIAAEMGFQRAPVLFELALAAIAARAVPRGRPASRFPGLRRDVALVVPEAVTAGALLAAVDEIAPEWLDRRFVFDIYRGKGIEPGRKSIALGLILQETSRTLTDDDADAFVHRLVTHLGERTGATLRD